MTNTPTLAEQIATLKRVREDLAGKYADWIRSGITHPELMRFNAAIATLEGMAAPGDAVERARKIAVRCVEVDFSKEADDPITLITSWITAAITAERAEARRAERERLLKMLLSDPVMEAAERAFVASECNLVTAFHAVRGALAAAPPGEGG